MTGTLLILPGGTDAARVARRAKELGLYVVVADGDPNAPGFACSDSRLIANGYSPEEAGAAAERFSRKVRRIDGVVSVASASANALAAVSGRLRIPGLSRRSGQLLTDRLAMMQRLHEAGIPVPWSREVVTPQDLARIAVERDHELVVRPAEGATRTGQQISAGKNLNDAFARAQSDSPAGRVVVEQHLTGRRIWSAALVLDGRCFTPAFADCMSAEPGDQACFAAHLPGAIDEDERARIGDLITRSASALGITEGPMECFIAVHQGEPYVVDVAARLPGALLSIHGILLSRGVDFAAAAIRLALGERILPSELEPVRSASVVQRFLPAPVGTIVSIEGADEARKIPGIVEIEVECAAADVIPPGASRPLATLLATGETHETAVDAANAALALIRVEVEPR